MGHGILWFVRGMIKRLNSLDWMNNRCLGSPVDVDPNRNVDLDYKLSVAFRCSIVDMSSELCEVPHGIERLYRMHREEYMDPGIERLCKLSRLGIPYRWCILVLFIDFSSVVPYSIDLFVCLYVGNW